MRPVPAWCVQVVKRIHEIRLSLLERPEKKLYFERAISRFCRVQVGAQRGSRNGGFRSRAGAGLQGERCVRSAIAWAPPSHARLLAPSALARMAHSRMRMAACADAPPPASASLQEDSEDPLTADEIAGVIHEVLDERERERESRSSQGHAPTASQDTSVGVAAATPSGTTSHVRVGPEASQHDPQGQPPAGDQSQQPRSCAWMPKVAPTGAPCAGFGTGVRAETPAEFLSGCVPQLGPLAASAWPELTPSVPLPSFHLGGRNPRGPAVDPAEANGSVDGRERGWLSVDGGTSPPLASTVSQAVGPLSMPFLGGISAGAGMGAAALQRVGIQRFAKPGTAATLSPAEPLPDDGRTVDTQVPRFRTTAQDKTLARCARASRNPPHSAAPLDGTRQAAYRRQRASPACLGSTHASAIAVARGNLHIGNSVLSTTLATPCALRA